MQRNTKILLSAKMSRWEKHLRENVSEKTPTVNAINALQAVGLDEM